VQVSSILAKLGVAGRVEAAAIAPVWAWTDAGQRRVVADAPSRSGA
jgi:hypothetical protein